MSKVDFLLFSSRYRAFKISVFLAQKNKIAKLGKLRLTKSNNMRTIWTTSLKDLSLNCVIV